MCGILQGVILQPLYCGHDSIKPRSFYNSFKSALNEASRYDGFGGGFISIWHYNDVTASSMGSQITSLTIVYSDADQRKRQSSASLAFMRGIHRWPVNSTHKWPVTRKMFPFDDVIMRSPDITHMTDNGLPVGAFGSVWYHFNFEGVIYVLWNTMS